MLQSKAYVDQHLVDDVDLSFAATTFSDDDSTDGLEGADNEAAGAGALSEPSSPTPETTASSFQSHRSKPQPVIAGPAIPKHVDDGRYRSGSQNSPSVRLLATNPCPVSGAPHRLACVFDSQGRIDSTSFFSKKKKCHPHVIVFF